MCIVTHVAQIITLYKIIHCVALHTLSGLTQKVSTVKFLHRKVSIFCVHSGKIYTGQKKFTQAPPVVPVTNMRYDYWTNSQFDQPNGSSQKFLSPGWVGGPTF